MNQGVFPNAYKVAQVIPLFKGGDAENFHGDCTDMIVIGIPCPGLASHPLMVFYKVVVMVPG